jgi:hypothetical protein
MAKNKDLVELSPEELAAFKLEMYSQVPLARAQIRSLRAQAEAAADLVGDATDHDAIGRVLTSVMLAGFALELGLKIFPMTYGSKRPRGHNLRKLFDELPEQIRNDISASYAASTFPKPLVLIYALISTKEQPQVPEGVRRARYDTAENVIEHSADAFTKARYFFEDVRAADWVTISHGVHYMLVLSHILDVVYDEYLKRGGWAHAPAGVEPPNASA